MSDNSPTTPTASRPTATPAEILDGLGAHTIPLSTTDPLGAFDDGLHAFDDLTADAAVIGLGEATHGTREFFRLKHRFVRYLVEEREVRLFGLEANLPETLALNRYLVDGEGNPREGLADTYFWTWQVESILALVEWLRTFNAGRPRDDRVRFHGFDMQYTQGAVAELIAFFEAVDPTFLDEVREDLTVVDDGGEPPHQNEDLDHQLSAAERVVSRICRRLGDCRDPDGAATDNRDVELAERHLRIVEQSMAHKQLTKEYRESDEGSEDHHKALRSLIACRDEAMAENALWLREFTGEDRMALWAHDAHLNREMHVHRGEGVAATPMGAHLADELGDDYLALGFAFARGAFQAMSYGTTGDTTNDAADDGVADAADAAEFALREQHLDGPIPGTFESALDELGHAHSVTNLRAAREDPRLADWLSTPRPHFSTGAVYDDDPEKRLTDYTFADAFDALCFVAETSRARPLE